MLIPAVSISPFRSSANVSLLKDEKVLNPPQNPIAIKKRQVSFSILESEEPRNKPSTSELRTFEASVP